MLGFMVVISEWLPNPKGKDSDGEWIELFNASPNPISLSGWSLEVGTGKKFVFKNTSMGGHAYLVLPRKTTSLSLRNKDETLFLKNTSGMIVDKSSLWGVAGEGESLSRKGNIFIATKPTPGAANSSQIRSLIEPPDFSLQKTLYLPESGLLGIATATIYGLFVVGLVAYILTSDAYLRKLFGLENSSIRAENSEDSSKNTTI